MIIIYHCFGGTHSSVLAAAVHTGLLDTEKRLLAADIAGLPYFDTRDGDDYGKLCAYGQDKQGNRIFVLGRRGFSEAPEYIFRQLQRLYGPTGRYKLVNSARTLNWQMRLGGYLSRRLRLKRLGLPLIMRGTRKALPRIAALVTGIQKEI